MSRIIKFPIITAAQKVIHQPQPRPSFHSFLSDSSSKNQSPHPHLQSSAPTTTMSPIPYDLLPSCDPNFARTQPKQNQSFANRFFGICACEDGNNTNLAALTSRNASRAFSPAPSSVNPSCISLSSKASSSSTPIATAPPRRPRSNTATSSTSVASSVSQRSVRSCAPYSRLPSIAQTGEERSGGRRWVAVCGRVSLGT
ncbi:hypothetical protein PMIN01_02951 [Paraphaeosphaeria minitans]|uniref:Uncharacterized protein n=1 Tax=Paraphaeosphaeria minitans TaxID=565426 RepID=A0A9P6GR61_9PLEO|nr:hypothetical protein PMIN01_02951 [Paraphaeosphaeria minitans]